MQKAVCEREAHYMAKSIMVQGTMSNAGKSLFTAGLCRVFKQDGYRTAPFKSQNMALNSYITKEGYEMGRAQVVQAEAAGIAPHVMMNPILLKPSSDKGSQVIVNGEVLGNMSAAEYYAYKKKLVPEIQKSFRALSEAYDIIVIEGAGSPAEINLKDNDIVNMGMAKMAGAPVLLVADIDRGGVFASIYGTVMLMDEEERNMLKGIVINKFRGDVEILRPGLQMMQEKINIPIIGVVPYLNVDIEDEDSLSDRLYGDKAIDLVDITVIQTPRMSNFTDFNVFELIPGVSLRYVKSVSELKNPDMLILPGTKNTMGDLLWMRQNGLEAQVRKIAEQGTLIFGICGGYQMLGNTLADPYGVEHGGSIKGIGLLNTETVFTKEKTRSQASGRFNQVGGMLHELSGKAFAGYEIHMGMTEINSGQPLLTIDCIAGRPVCNLDGINEKNVFGSYIHGLFDGDGIAQTIAASLLRKKGLEPSGIKTMSYRDYKETQYDLLAAELRKAVDMAAVYKILAEGI